ncbi:MAG: hypothetical protein HYR62_06815 [Actinobacteria bacterium]|nr:hypothetical protein [Actinomycetota bacterium]MBI3688295.1 hypothetical protein [Actinomycetota bacterium]
MARSIHTSLAAAGVVVAEHDRVVADAQLRHALGEQLRVGQRVAPLRRAGRAGQPPVEVDEHCCRHHARSSTAGITPATYRTGRLPATRWR